MFVVAMHLVAFLVHPTIWGDSDCLTAYGFTEAWLRCPMCLPGQKPLAETLDQGLTRHGRIGDQDVPGQVASQQSLPLLLRAEVLQQIAISPCNHWTSE